MDQAQAPSSPSNTSNGKATRGMLAILYDGACEMCRTSVQAIEKFDTSGKIEPIDLHIPEARAKFPLLEMKDQEQLFADHGALGPNVICGKDAKFFDR